MTKQEAIKKINHANALVVCKLASMYMARDKRDPDHECKFTIDFDEMTTFLDKVNKMLNKATKALESVNT